MDSRNTKQFVAPVREANQSAADGLVNTRWNSGGHRCNCPSRTLIDQDLDQLDSEQGVPIRPFINQLNRRLRQSNVAQSFRHLADGDLRKTSKVHAPTIRIATQSTERALQWCRSRSVGVPIGTDNE